LTDARQAAISGFLFGYDTAVIGVALPHVGSDLGHPLTSGEQEIIAGCTIGAILGSAILGTLADRLGRRLSLFIADVL
jgi:MFS family permease